MPAQPFPFTVDGRACFAQGHALSNPRVSLAVSLGSLFKAHDINFALTPAEARAMAAALEAAATYAENVLPSGLGESAVEAPAIKDGWTEGEQRTNEFRRREGM